MGSDGADEGCHGLVRLERIEHQLNALELNSKMSHMQEVLEEVQRSLSSQGILLQELRESSILSLSYSQRPQVESGSASGLLPSSRSILKKQVRTEEEAHFIPIPDAALAPILPGEVKELKLEEKRGDDLPVPRPPRSRLSRPRPEPAASLTMHANSMDELSTLMARELLGQHSRTSSERPGSNSQALGDVEQPEDQLQDERSDSKRSHAAVLEKTQKMSLDELRTNHDAQALVVSTSRTTSTDLDTRGGMPLAAELWMVLAGILESKVMSLSRLWWFFLQMTTVSVSGALLWFSQEFFDVPQVVTTICYMFGVAVSIWLLRGGEVQELVGAKGNLDMFARRNGFIKEWRKKSRARFYESLGFLLMICGSRFLGYAQDLPLLPDLFPNLAFCCAATGFTALVYMQLHLFSGLELAIDSFSINFFRTMDIEVALAEWNVVQATLRHVSAKLSKSLLVLGSSCCGASLLYLIHLAFVRTDVERGMPLILTSFWLLPPMFFFLYAMMRAAAVTEKASRVSPLVNSWTFEREESEDAPKWMDLGRQYVVQYISQSEAGFYMQGVRIRIFQVTKMGYFLGAIVFAVVTRFLG